VWARHSRSVRRACGCALSTRGTTPPSAPASRSSDRRLLFGKPTFLGRTPSRFWSELDYAKVAQIVAVRHGLLTGVAFAFNHGAVIEVEAVRGRRLRQLVAVIDAHLPRT